MNPVYKFIDSDNREIGCGTQVELDYWTAQGVMVGVRTGAIITHEPASMDVKRQAAWAKYA